MTYQSQIIPLGACSFLTLRLADPTHDHLVAKVGLLRQAMRHTLTSHPFQIEAICVLPNTLHTIWTLPPGDTDLGGRVAVLKSTFTAALPHNIVPRGGNGRANLWQSSFWSHPLLTEDELADHRQLIYQAPVVAGLCEKPKSWAHSSIHRDDPPPGRPIRRPAPHHVALAD